MGKCKATKQSLAGFPWAKLIDGNPSLVECKFDDSISTTSLIVNKFFVFGPGLWFKL